MINLLPEDSKREIQAARMNVVLFRYNLLVLGAIGVLAAICLVFFGVLQATQSAALSTSSSNDDKAKSYADVRKAADEYRTNLTIASQVLDKGVDYTSVVFGLTKLLPDNVVLDGITLNASDFGKQITFTARAKSYDDASKLKASFQNSKLLSNAYFQNVSDTGDAPNSQKASYPIVISISAKLNEITQ